ncbi:retrovirus-related pol polyprotein from transposon TNT 1-94 [Tanacetum coccineum]
MAKIQEVSLEETSSTSQPLEQENKIRALGEATSQLQRPFTVRPKCATFLEDQPLLNPKYLKKAQSDKPRLYEIPYDTSDPANRFCPNGEETVTLEKESRFKWLKPNSNSRTSNVNAVCAECGTCVFNSNHDACVSRYLKDFAPILGYGDLIQGNVMIKRVYYVEGLNHNLFSVGQFCDADLEVAFRKSTCFVRDLQGNDLLTASPTQAWLWHRRLSHLNFDYITLLSKKEVVNGLPKLKYVKDQLCSSCEMSKAKRSSFKTKAVPSSKGRLNLLHMDLCGPMRVASINGKKSSQRLSYDDSTQSFKLKLLLSGMTEATEILEQDTLCLISKKKGIEIQNFPLSKPTEPLRWALSKDGTILLLRLLERCFQLLSFHYHSGLKQLQLHALLRTDQSLYPLLKRRISHHN